MTYKNYTIEAEGRIYKTYSVGDDGTIGDVIWEEDEPSDYEFEFRDVDGELVDCGFITVNAAKRAIDVLVGDTEAPVKCICTACGCEHEAADEEAL